MRQLWVDCIEILQNNKTADMGMQLHVEFEPLSFKVTVNVSCGGFMPDWNGDFDPESSLEALFAQSNRGSAWS